MPCDGGGDGDAVGTWPAVAGGVESDEGYSIAALADGFGAIVTGTFFDDINFAAADTVSGSAVTLGDPDCPTGLRDQIFVTKVTTQGKWQWAIDLGDVVGTCNIGGTSADFGKTISARADGSMILVTGAFEETLSFGGTEVSSVPSNRDDIFVARLSVEGVFG